MNSPELEVLALIYGVLSGDATLTTQTGVNPDDGTARPVAVYNQVVPDAPVPYVRITITNTTLIEAEPMQYDYTPTVKRLLFTVNVISDYEPEVLSISTRLQELLQHREITTAHFHGNTWMSGGVQYYTDNISDPDRLYRMAAVRIRADVEPV